MELMRLAIHSEQVSYAPGSQWFRVQRCRQHVQRFGGEGIIGIEEMDIVCIRQACAGVAGTSGPSILLINIAHSFIFKITIDHKSRTIGRSIVYNNYFEVL